MNKKFYLILNFYVLLIIILLPINVANQSQMSYDISNNSINDSDILLNQIINLDTIIEMVNISLFSNWISNIESFGPHQTGSESLEQVKKYIYNELSNFSINVSLHPWENNDYNGENIVATLPGLIPNNEVIVTAHYDTVPVSPGADDDGSGIACILMMASILCKYQFNTTIKFIIFSGEEQGCYGSYQYAKEAYENNINIIGVISLDKIGYAKTIEDGRIIRHHANPASTWMIDLSENISKKYYNEIGLNVDRYPFDASSDHRSFVEFGYPGSNFVENTLNPYYHTSEDLLKHMNLSYLSKVCKLSMCTIATIAQGYSNLSNNDISIYILGKRNNEYNAKISIIVENKKYLIQNVNLSITIEMTHLIKNTPVMIKKEFYEVPCIWNLFGEVEHSFKFHIGPQTYTKGFFRLTVSVHGVNDDYPVSLSCDTFGLVYPSHNIMIIPKTIN